MMLPTDIALMEDDQFRPTVQLYAKDQDKFFVDFKAAYEKLLSLGCPPAAQPGANNTSPVSDADAAASRAPGALHARIDRARPGPSEKWS